MNDIAKQLEEHDEQVEITPIVMKCYVLIGNLSFEASKVLGVYWTEQAAEQAKRTVERAGSYFSNFVIEEHELQG